ncbi:MAG: hypothetical protein EXR72_08070 [Myxococcales bacterium]|nr:hypothetical protein [Myxococcales bacterium]
MLRCTHHPDCVVEQMIWQNNGSVAVTAMPECTSPPSTRPCWRAEPKDRCAVTSPQGIGFAIDRDGGFPPDNSELRAWCDVISG